MKKILLIILCVLFMTGCGSVSNVTKTAKSIEDFEAVAKDKGFTVTENDKTYVGVTYILGHGKITHGESTVEMIVYDDNEKAEKVQLSHIESFDLLKTTGAQAKKEKGNNFYHYSLISNNRYMASTRIDNTLIFCKVMVEDKELVESLINELGY